MCARKDGYQDNRTKKATSFVLRNGAGLLPGVIARRMNGEPKEGRCAMPCRANCTGIGKHRVTAAIQLSF